MATTYVSMANLTKYDTLLKAYIADGWYDKIEIDQFIATIEQREANYVDRSVNDLVNYYTKSQTYTKAETNALISTIPTFSIEVVDELPTEDISTTTIYLLRNDGSEAGNIFTEYLYVDDEWEVLGSQSIDLSDYYTCEEVDYLIPKRVSELQNDAGYVRQIDIDSNMVAGIKGVNDLEYQRGYVTINKQMVGLSLVENKSPQQILNSMTEDNVTSALGFMPLDESTYVQNSSTQDGFVPKSNGVANKVWGTDSNGEPGWLDNSGGGGGAVTGVKGSAEVEYRTGNVIISKDNIGLGNVENKSSQTIRNELTQAEVLTKIGVLPTANGGTGNSVGYIQTGKATNTNVGTASTIEGRNNTVTGKQSHGEGYGVRVTSNYAHAEGYNTTASGSTSHAEGTGTVAGYANQHVSGKYNNNKNSTLLEIGNGTSTSAKSNAFEVYDDGFISTGEEAKIKFGKNASNQYGYFKEGESTLTPFGSGGGVDVEVQGENLIFS